MGKDKEVKFNFQLKHISEYYRWMNEIPTVLSKCKLPPRTFKMANAQFNAWFNAGDAEQKTLFLGKINQCTGAIGESIIDSTAKKAWYVQHIAERPSLIGQARMLREWVTVVKTIVTPTQIEVQRKLDLAKFQMAFETEPTENIILTICSQSMMNIGKSWRA